MEWLSTICGPISMMLFFCLPLMMPTLRAAEKTYTLNLFCFRTSFAYLSHSPSTWGTHSPDNSNALTASVFVVFSRQIISGSEWMCHVVFTKSEVDLGVLFTTKQYKSFSPNSWRSLVIASHWDSSLMFFSNMNSETSTLLRLLTFECVLLLLDKHVSLCPKLSLGTLAFATKAFMHFFGIWGTNSIKVYMTWAQQNILSRFIFADIFTCCSIRKTLGWKM